MMNKTCLKEKKRPEFKGKPKKEEKPVYKEPEIHEISGIRYIVLGNTPYAVDEKGVIDYSETAVLRKILNPDQKI